MFLNQYLFIFNYKLKNINNNITITNRNNIGNENDKNDEGTITESSEDDGSNYDENSFKCLFFFKKKK